MISKYRRWTIEEDRLLEKLYQKKTLFELADLFNRHWNKVCRRAIRLGIKKDKIAFGKGISKTHKQMFKDGRRSNKGEKNPNWKGGNTPLWGGITCGQYGTIHNWLRKNFGKAKKCEGKNCTKKSLRFEWAKIREKKYEKNRKNFIMLCKSCHAKYDVKKS